MMKTLKGMQAPIKANSVPPVCGELTDKAFSLRMWDFLKDFEVPLFGLSRALQLWSSPCQSRNVLNVFKTAENRTV